MFILFKGQKKHTLVLFAIAMAFCQVSYGAACYSAWSSSTQYGPNTSCGGGTPYQVSYGGRNYTARYCSTNSNPSSNSQSGWGNWIDNGACTSCSSVNAGSIGSSKSICYNTSAGTLTNSSSGSGGNGSSYSYQWQSSSNNSSWSNVGGTSTTYSPGSLTSSTYYRRAVTSGTCGTDYTSSILVTVYADLTSGSIGSAQSICYNTSPSSLTNGASPTGGTGSYTYQWQSSSNNSSWSNVGGTSSTYSPSNLTSSTYFRRQATSGSCGTENSSSILITVTANLTISGSTTGARCNSGTVVIQATASAGSIEWFTASSGGSSIGSSSSGAGWTTPSISSTTTYYAEALNGSCISVTRTSVTATVNVASIGPAGITGELLLWLKADIGTSSIGTSWEDQSCNGFDYTTVTGPSKESSDWNYNPAIEILSGGFNAPAGSELGTDWTVFFVSKLMASDNDGRLIDGHSGDYLLGYHEGYRNAIDWNSSPSEYNSGIATTSGIESPHIFTYVRENSGSTINSRVDGDALKTFTSTNSGSGIRLDINQGASGEETDSRVGELIIFSKELSATEITKVEAYLATKYAIPLSDNDGSTGGDYISSGGTTYWDASASPDYNNGIVVIGKDDDSALEQKQAITEDDSLIIFISTIAVDNASNGGSVTNDESFLAIGHNGGLLHSTAASSSESASGISTRFAREWKVTNTNFDDDFSLEIEWKSGTTVDLAHLTLLVDDDGNFSDATAYDASDGLTFSIGSIIINGISTTMIPNGSTKYITVGSTNFQTTLPVELLSFTAVKEGGVVLLQWETATEINNDYFKIEKSTDGISWDFGAQISGAGNSDSQLKYAHIDYSYFTGSCYYKLTQVDFDGKETIYKAIILNSEDKEYIFKIAVNPNPIQKQVTVLCQLPEDGTYSFAIISSSGQLKYEAKIVGVQGDNNFTYNTSLLANGIYYFTIKDIKGNLVQQKCIKTN